jgi:hypothetical protein
MAIKPSSLPCKAEALDDAGVFLDSVLHRPYDLSEFMVSLERYLN